MGKLIDMNRSLFVAALAVMSVCVASCSDDDKGRSEFSETFTLKIDALNEMDSTEYAKVKAAYYDVFGLADSARQVVVWGKDSADCCNAFTDKLKIAEQSLHSASFSSDIEVSAYNSNKFSVYDCTFGQGENGLHVSCELFSNLDKYDCPYVGQFCVCDGFFSITDLPSSCDVNKHTFGDDVKIYAWPSRGYFYENTYDDGTRQMDQYIDSEISGVVIWDATASGLGSSDYPPETFTYNGCTYKVARYQNNETCNPDIRFVTSLNADAKHRIFLYYTHSSLPGHHLLLHKLAICSRYKTFLWAVSQVMSSTVNDFSYAREQMAAGYDVEFAPMVYTRSDGSVVMKNANGNLNEGQCEGSYPAMYQYLLCVYE